MRNPGNEDYTVQKLAGHISSILCRKVFSELELVEIKGMVSLVLYAVDTSEYLNSNSVVTKSPPPSNDIDSTNADVVRQDCGESTPLDESLIPMKEEILKKCEFLHGSLNSVSPSLQSVPQKKLNKLMSDANKVLSFIPTNTLSDLHHLLYCAASVIIECSGYTPKRNITTNNQPQWKECLLSKIKSLQADLSRLHSLKNKRLFCGKTLSDLHRKYNLNADSDISVTCEFVLQRIRDYLCRLKRYEARHNFTRQNQMFKHHKHDFFNMLSNSVKCDVGSPPLDDTLRFWKELWGSPCQHDISILPYINDALGAC